MNAVALSLMLNEYLDVDSIVDYCPNGLQVENSGAPIQKICTSVTASLEAIELAASLSAQVLIVHHGYFWKSEDLMLRGMKYRRIKALLKHDMALLAYHLPLDIHPVCGNNAELARLLGLTEINLVSPAGKLPILLVGKLAQPMHLEGLTHLCQTIVRRVPMVVPGGDRLIRRVAVCTGAGQDYIEAAKMAGADAFISGEISERTYYQARELGIHYLACGHHATERFGIQALGAWVAEKCGVPVEFIDSMNPV